MPTPNPDRFAIIPLHPNQPAPGNSIMHGSLSAVMERIIDSRAPNDALDLLNQAADALTQLEHTRDQETQIVARGLQTLVGSIDAISRRLDSIESQRADQARQDAEAEAERVQAQLDQLPDPDEPNAPAFYHPSGELHTVAPSNAQPTADEDHDPGSMPDPDEPNDSNVLPEKFEREAPGYLGSLPPASEIEHPKPEPMGAIEFG